MSDSPPLERVVEMEHADAGSMCFWRGSFPNSVVRWCGAHRCRRRDGARKIAESRPAFEGGRATFDRAARFAAAGPVPEDIPLEILFEDEHLAAINKPPGMVVHPAKGHWSGTLTAALAFHFQQLSGAGGASRPGIVHRLDRDTSGVLVVAKTDAAHYALAEQFAGRTVEKEYFAIVVVAPDWTAT